MSVYREYRFFSPALDADAVRLSVVDDRGLEYFAIVPVAPPGRRWREWRDEVLGRLDEAVALGATPGEVRV